jgi:hypothetical protein
MRFKTLEELVKYIVTEPINLEYTDVQFQPYEEMNDKPKETKKEPVKENFEAKISSFFDSPIVQATFSDDNILFVESVEGSRDFCGAGKVNLLGREIMTNLCESDGTAYVKLSIDINDKIVENVLFKLQAATSETINTIRIRKDIIND